MKNFNDIYEVLYREYNDKLEQIRKDVVKEQIITLIMALVITIILSKIFHSWIFIVLALVIVVFRFAFSRKSRLYKTIFKGELIKKLVKENDENLDFEPERGIASIIYNKGEFERYDVFKSEDLITGKLEGKYKINMAEVHTQDKRKDSDGDTHYVTLFHGLFAEIEIDKIVFGKLKLRKNELKLFGGNKERVELDSGEFERLYDVYSTDKIMAMQLLTSDIMQMFIDFKEKYKITPELTLKENKLYIRFGTGNMFEAILMKKALDYTTLLEYYDTIKFTLDITKEFIKNVKETEI